MKAIFESFGNALTRRWASVSCLRCTGVSPVGAVVFGLAEAAELVTFSAMSRAITTQVQRTLVTFSVYLIIVVSG